MAGEVGVQVSGSVKSQGYLKQRLTSIVKSWNTNLR